MRVLVIDTSSARSTAGVADLAADPTPRGGGDRGDGPRPVVLAERHADDGRAHGELLAGLVARALADAGTGVGDLDAVVVGAGPGPFTGLRVGIVTALTLAALRGIPVHGVGSLDAIAAVVPERPLLVVTDARRREVYWARYERGGPDEVPARVDRPVDVEVGDAVVTGAAAALYPDRFGASLGADHPTVAGLVQCARIRLLQGAPSERVEPRYLRRPDAVVPTHRKPTVPS